MSFKASGMPSSRLRSFRAAHADRATTVHFYDVTAEELSILTNIREDHAQRAGGVGKVLRDDDNAWVAVGREAPLVPEATVVGDQIRFSRCA